MHVRQNTELADRVMSCIQPKVTQTMEVVLDSPISRLELSEALRGLRRGFLRVSLGKCYPIIGSWSSRDLDLRKAADWAG